MMRRTCGRGEGRMLTGSDLVVGLPRRDRKRMRHLSARPARLRSAWHNVALWLPETTDRSTSTVRVNSRWWICSVSAPSVRCRMPGTGVIAAMQAQTELHGRHLRGRPPYGRRLAWDVLSSSPTPIYFASTSHTLLTPSYQRRAAALRLRLAALHLAGLVDPRGCRRRDHCRCRAAREWGSVKGVSS